MKISLLQIDIVYAEPAKNLERIVKLIRQCAEGPDKPDVILLPELWNTSMAWENIDELADRSGSPCAETVRELAGKYGINIVAGSVADKRDGKVHNTTYVFDRQGNTVALYDKIHLFSLMEEQKHITPGNKLALFELDGVKCGVIICYDVRFPELARSYALSGAKILFIAAQFPYPRYSPWDILVQARAIENQMFVVGVNRVGSESNKIFFGNSMIVEPRGDVLVRGGEEEEIITAEIDLKKVEVSRNYLTCLKDRVASVYLCEKN